MREKGSILESRMSKINEGKSGSFDKKELDTLLALVDAMKAEESTKVMTMTREQRRTVIDLSNGYNTKEKVKEAYMATLKDGFFNVRFNNNEDGMVFMMGLEQVLGKKNGFYFERVTLNNGKKVMVPGFSFGGSSVKGVITERRLFKR